LPGGGGGPLAGGKKGKGRGTLCLFFTGLWKGGRGEEGVINPSLVFCGRGAGGEEGGKRGGNLPLFWKRKGDERGEGPLIESWGGDKEGKSPSVTLRQRKKFPRGKKEGKVPSPLPSGVGVLYLVKRKVMPLSLTSGTNGLKYQRKRGGEFVFSTSQRKRGGPPMKKRKDTACIRERRREEKGGQKIPPTCI